MKTQLILTGTIIVLAIALVITQATYRSERDICQKWKEAAELWEVVALTLRDKVEDVGFVYYDDDGRHIDPNMQYQLVVDGISF